MPRRLINTVRSPVVIGRHSVVNGGKTLRTRVETSTAARHSVVYTAPPCLNHRVDQVELHVSVVYSFYAANLQ
jgi:hypothetical protein